MLYFLCCIYIKNKMEMISLKEMKCTPKVFYLTLGMHSLHDYFLIKL